MDDRENHEMQQMEKTVRSAAFTATVGMRGFEPPTSCSQSRRANQAALHPEDKTKTRLFYSLARNNAIRCSCEISAAGNNFKQTEDFDIGLFTDDPIQLTSQSHESFCPVAYGVFHIGTELGKRCIVSLRNEEWIVTEASRAPRLEADPPFERSFGGNKISLYVEIDGRTAKTGRPLRLLDERKLSEQLFVVRPIIGAFTGKPRASHPRCTAKRVDLEPGIVGDRRHTEALDKGFGLDNGVLVKTPTVFGNLVPAADFMKADELYVLDSQNLFYFPDFPFVFAGYDRLRHP